MQIELGAALQANVFALMNAAGVSSKNRRVALFREVPTVAPNAKTIKVLITRVLMQTAACLVMCKCVIHRLPRTGLDRQTGRTCVLEGILRSSHIEAGRSVTLRCLDPAVEADVYAQHEVASGVFIDSAWQGRIWNSRYLKSSIPVSDCRQGTT